MDTASRVVVCVRLMSAAGSPYRSSAVGQAAQDIVCVVLYSLSPSC